MTKNYKLKRQQQKKIRRRRVLTWMNWLTTAGPSSGQARVSAATHLAMEQYACLWGSVALWE